MQRSKTHEEILAQVRQTIESQRMQEESKYRLEKPKVPAAKQNPPSLKTSNYTFNISPPPIPVKQIATYNVLQVYRCIYIYIIIYIIIYILMCIYLHNYIYMYIRML